jgi:anti-sigma regulatory factor (Ser/Thr protein kinase)
VTRDVLGSGGKYLR